MEPDQTDHAIDMDEYRAQTDALIDSIEETTALLSEMTENMAHLSRSFEDFGSTRTQLAQAQTQSHAEQPSVAAD